MHIKKIIVLIMAVIMLGAGIYGCSDNKEEEKQVTKSGESSTKIVEETSDTKIFDGKKEIRSFTINGVLHATEGSYIDDYTFEKEKTKNIFHLKGKFEIKGTMDGEVRTVTEAKLEIADECVFNDNRSGGENGMNLEEFQEHINSKDFQKTYSMTITVDNGLVWMVELFN